MWLAKNASPDLTEAFDKPFPEDASIVQISAEASKDGTLEADLLAVSEDWSITRTQLKDGSVVLLFVPKKANSTDTHAQTLAAPRTSGHTDYKNS